MLQFLLGADGPTVGDDALPLYTSDIPTLTPSSSWTSFLSRSSSGDSLSGILPEADQSQTDIGEVAPIDDEDHIVMAPPQGPKREFAKGYERYHPDRYRCTGYDVESYQWFDGYPEASDQRFIIDLEHGSMDRLPDVRPFLYFVGYMKGRTQLLPRHYERHQSTEIEEFFVQEGRQYLLIEWKVSQSGYYLMDRDWLALSRYHNKTMPYAACTLYGNPDSTGRMNGDVGIEKADFTKHERPDAFISVGECPKVMKTNLRAPLPVERVCTVAPGGEHWDGFIRYLYGHDHPVYYLQLQGFTVATAQNARAKGHARFYMKRGRS